MKVIFIKIKTIKLDKISFYGMFPKRKNVIQDGTIVFSLKYFLRQKHKNRLTKNTQKINGKDLKKHFSQLFLKWEMLRKNEEKWRKNDERKKEEKVWKKDGKTFHFVWTGNVDVFWNVFVFRRWQNVIFTTLLFLN